MGRDLQWVCWCGCTGVQVGASAQVVAARISCGVLSTVQLLRLGGADRRPAPAGRRRRLPPPPQRSAHCFTNHCSTLRVPLMLTGFFDGREAKKRQRAQRADFVCRPLQMASLARAPSEQSPSEQLVHGEDRLAVGVELGLGPGGCAAAQRRLVAGGRIRVGELLLGPGGGGAGDRRVDPDEFVTVHFDRSVVFFGLERDDLSSRSA